MTMPELAPGHENLKRFAGTWTGDETMHASQWCPEPFVAQGTNAGRLALNGFAAIIDYEQRKDGQVTFTGHGVLTYEPGTDEYRMTWFDCMGTGPETFRGRFTGGVLVTESSRGPIRSRLTYDFREDGRWLGRMEMSPDGEHWNTVFDADYRRA